MATRNGILVTTYQGTNKLFFVTGLVLAILAATVTSLEPTTVVKIVSKVVWLLQMIFSHMLSITTAVTGVFLALAGRQCQKIANGEPPKTVALLGDPRISSSFLLGFFLIFETIGIYTCDVSMVLTSMMIMIAAICVINFTSSLLDEVTKQITPSDTCTIKLLEQKAVHLMILGILAIGFSVVIFPKIACIAPNQGTATISTPANEAAPQPLSK